MSCRRRARGERPGSSRTRGSPPCAAMSRRKRSSAEPSAMRLPADPRASSRTPARSPITTISAASSMDRSSKSARPFASEALDALGHLDRVAHGAAQRLVHPGDQGAHPLAQAAADRAHRLAPECSRIVEPSMKAPPPVLTSSTSPSIPSASFFDMIDAEIKGIDSTVAVASRRA